MSKFQAETAINFMYYFCRNAAHEELTGKAGWRQSDETPTTYNG